MIIRLLICFLAGSVPFAIVAMAGSGIDIRKVGSGNPGFNNVLRVSKVRAVLALVGDMGKGLVAVWLVLRFWPVSPDGASVDAATLGWLYGFAAVLGHCYSPLLRLNGGKGIATSGGVMLVLHPLWAAVALVYFTIARVTLGKTKAREAGTLASLTTWLLFAALMLGFVGRQDAFYATFMTLFLVLRHKKNLENLLRPAAARMPAQEKLEAREDYALARRSTDN